MTPDGSNYAMSRPTFDPKRGEIWYSDADSGFYALRVTKRRLAVRGAAAGLPGERSRCLSRRNFGIRLDRAEVGAGTVDGRA